MLRKVGGSVQLPNKRRGTSKFRGRGSSIEDRDNVDRRGMPSVTPLWTMRPLPLLDSWDCEPPALPPRSRLYALEPIGIGTPHVESLTGYVSRIADAHAV